MYFFIFELKSILTHTHYIHTLYKEFYALRLPKFIKLTETVDN